MKSSSPPILRELFGPPAKAAALACTGECRYTYNPNTQLYEHTGGECVGTGGTFCPDCPDTISSLARDLLLLLQEVDVDEVTFPCGATEADIIENMLRKILELYKEKLGAS